MTRRSPNYGRDVPDWRRVKCPTCGSKAGKWCRSLKDGKRRPRGSKIQAHPARRKIAPIEEADDRDLVPDDWAITKALIDLERLEKWEAKQDMITKALAIMAQGFTRKVAADRLGVNYDWLGKLLRSLRPRGGSLPYTRALMIRPPHQREGHGEIQRFPSGQRCGGGWRHDMHE